MRSSALAFSVAVTLCLVATGCEDPNGRARFVAGDTGGTSECIAGQFPFEPTLLAARTQNNQTGIFLQTSPDVKSQSDVAYLQIYDTDAAARSETIEVHNGSSDSAARGKMVFLSSCPNEFETLQLIGSIQFDSFDPTPNGIIDGDFTGQALDARSGEVAIEDLDGSWRFLVRQGPPYEDFYALPERP